MFHLRQTRCTSSSAMRLNSWSERIGRWNKRLKRPSVKMTPNKNFQLFDFTRYPSCLSDPHCTRLDFVGSLQLAALRLKGALQTYATPWLFWSSYGLASFRLARRLGIQSAV